MHMPVIIAIFALILLVIVTGVFVAVRILGQRVYNRESADHGTRDTDSAADNRLT